MAHLPALITCKGTLKQNILGDALPPSVTDLIASTPELEDIDESAYPRAAAAR